MLVFCRLVGYDLTCGVQNLLFGCIPRTNMRTLLLQTMASDHSLYGLLPQPLQTWLAQCNKSTVIHRIQSKDSMFGSSKGHLQSASCIMQITVCKSVWSPDYKTLVDLWSYTIAMEWPYPYIPRLFYRCFKGFLSFKSFKRSVIQVRKVW